MFKLNIKIFSVNYRRSPEYKFPIPFNDCFDAYEWISNHAELLEVDPEMISVGGDSAGGNLATSICIERKKKEKPLPMLQLGVARVRNEGCQQGF